MSLLRSVSWICQAWTLNSAVWPVLSPTHPHAVLYCDWPLSREREESLTMVDWQVYTVLPSSSWLYHRLLLRDCLDALWQPVLHPRVFKPLTMLQVFYSWLESMWLGTELDNRRSNNFYKSSNSAAETILTLTSKQGSNHPVHYWADHWSLHCFFLLEQTLAL